MNINVLGQRIKELRMKKGLKQQELSEGICTPSMISQVESGRARPSHDILVGIADRLDVSLEFLMADANLNMKVSSNYKMARGFIASQQYRTAVELLEEVLMEPDTRTPSAEVKIDLAECYLHEKAYDQAYSFLHEVLEEAALTKGKYQLAGALKLLGEIEFELQRYAFALRHWKRAVEAVEKSNVRNRVLLIPLLVKLGICYQAINQDQEAISCFQRAARLNDKTTDLNSIADLYMHMSAAYQSTGDHWKASSYAERAVGICEGLGVLALGEDIRTKYASFLEEENETEKEIEAVWSSIQGTQEENSSEVGFAYLRLAKLYEKLDQHESAIQVCEQANQLLPTQHPDRTELYRVWSWAAFQNGDWDRAKELEASREEGESRGIEHGEANKSRDGEMGQ
ncbi:helix-turn-helix domain-containing protein [Tumebacillus permanentifrigoris]|uniref:Tetratricopeptide repeat protein n=1 Tax=Tumebacillus permanentifrigoris TaxID=378543 RepID=A0A316DBR8_9BACL|nr:helix-turn-helix transcriptional regulator [Tumebacillus permanentifrigoris]PWK14450.1 tetratricopeptide repeat protein [Tumebacillus permanentifrigoris]